MEKLLGHFSRLALMVDVADDVNFCARECERQKSGEMSVSNMFLSLIRCRDLAEERDPSVGAILALGSSVEPAKNYNGFRKTPVMIAGAEVQPVHHSLVEGAIVNLCKYGKDLSPEEFYKEFETIHPFIDGNGRVGALLFNWLNGSLYMPIPAPDCFAPTEKE
jgi:hypothetical protein